MYEAALLGGLFVVVALEQALLLHGFPIEVVLPIAFLQMGRSPESAVLVLLVGTAATTAGAWFAYEAARLGRRRVSRGRFARFAEGVAQRLEGRTSLVGVLRLVPFARAIVSPVAGLAGVPRGKYLAWTTVGNGAFVALLVGGTFLLP